MPIYSGGAGGVTDPIVFDPTGPNFVQLGNGGLRMEGANAFVEIETATGIDIFTTQMASVGEVLLGPAAAAPPDGDLSAGYMGLWFDDTNGAAKLMLKGKTANGTVVAASVALA